MVVQMIVILQFTSLFSFWFTIYNVFSWFQYQAA